MEHSGNLLGTADYGVFDALRGQTGAASALGFTGGLFTATTGLLHLNARDLSLNLGRFLSADTVQPNAPGTQGYNLYAYVANNPTTWVDPSGHNPGAGTWDMFDDPQTFKSLMMFGEWQFIGLLGGLMAFPWTWAEVIGIISTILVVLIITLIVIRLTLIVLTAIKKYHPDWTMGGPLAVPLPDLKEIPLGWPRLPEPPVWAKCIAQGIKGSLWALATGDFTSGASSASSASGIATDFFAACMSGSGGGNGDKGKTGGNGSDPDIFKRIIKTQEDWPGTNLPRSFEITASDGSKYWVHPNATKHMSELLGSTLAGNTRFSEQILLESFDQAISTASQQGIQYDQMMVVGKWELIFSRPREPGLLPVIKHALYIP